MHRADAVAMAHNWSAFEPAGALLSTHDAAANRAPAREARREPNGDAVRDLRSIAV